MEPDEDELDKVMLVLGKGIRYRPEDDIHYVPLDRRMHMEWETQYRSSEEEIIKALNKEKLELISENNTYRAHVGELTTLIKEMRAKLVEQDSVIEKLVGGKSGSRMVN